jgi:hypothetical protein
MSYVAGMSPLRMGELSKLTPPVLSSKTEGRSLHSFAHALTTCIENVRLQLSKFPDYTPARIPLNPSALFLKHDVFEDVLEAIASLCGRVGLLTLIHMGMVDLCCSSSHLTWHHRNTLHSRRNTRCSCLISIPTYKTTSKKSRCIEFERCWRISLPLLPEITYSP